MSGAATSGLYWRVASVTARDALVVLPEEVGKFVQVMAGGAVYQALAAGVGEQCWGGEQGSSYGRYYRTFTFLDSDIAVADTSAVIDFGPELPPGALVVSVISNVAESFTDGDVGTFSADVGIIGDDDLYTPTALDIDGAVAVQSQSSAQDADGVQLKVKFSGSVNLSTLTAGEVGITVLYVIPLYTEVSAP